MCLILFSYRPGTDTPLVVLANRDEFYHRPTAPLSQWDNPAKTIAGTDLEMGGTWMGITQAGRFAAITNYRDPSRTRKDARSRGLLVSEFLDGNDSPESYLSQILISGDNYNGFNLLAGDPKHGLWYGSNRAEKIIRLSHGIHGLSNHLLDTEWPKVKRGKKMLEALLTQSPASIEAEGFSILADTEKPEDALLPETGMGIEWERILSPLFITSDISGTRSSAVITVSKAGDISFTEKTFDVENGRVKKNTTRHIAMPCMTPDPYGAQQVPV